MIFDKTSLEKLAQQLLTEHGLSDWRFHWDKAKRRLGCCKYGPKIITLSLPNAQLNEKAVSIETLKHEIAHALTPDDGGHGVAWKRMARQLGCSAERCANQSVNVVKGEYRARCQACGQEFHLHRQTKKNCLCQCTRGEPQSVRAKYRLTFRHINDIRDPELVPCRIVILSNAEGIPSWHTQVLLATSLLLPKKLVTPLSSLLVRLRCVSLAMFALSVKLTVTVRMSPI